MKTVTLKEEKAVKGIKIEIKNGGNINFGSYVAALVSASGMTFQKIADEMGWNSRSQISEMISGKAALKLSLVSRFCQLLDADEATCLLLLTRDFHPETYDLLRRNFLIYPNKEIIKQLAAA